MKKGWSDEHLFYDDMDKFLKTDIKAIIEQIRLEKINISFTIVSTKTWP